MVLTCLSTSDSWFLWLAHTESVGKLITFWLTSSVYDLPKIINIHRFMPSVLCHCWLGSRKGIQPVKNWVIGCWRGCLSGASCRRIWPSWCHCSLSLASVKSRLVLPFWYRLIQVVPDKGPLNGCVCVIYYIAISIATPFALLINPTLITLHVFIYLSLSGKRYSN